MGIPFERCATCDHYLAQHARHADKDDNYLGYKCFRGNCRCNDFVMKERPPKKDINPLYGVKPLWRLGSYDGPVTGICEYEGKLHYFEMLGAPGSFIGKRAYAVYKLTPMERLREWVGHQIFKLLAGDYENLNEYGIAPGRRWKFVNGRQKVWSSILRIHDVIRFWPTPRYKHRYHYETQPALGYFTFKERDDEDEEA